MDSNVHYTIDLNKDQNNQPFFSPLGSSLLHQQAPSNTSSSTSPSLSYFPFLINSHHDQVNLGYNSSNTIHGVLDPHLSQPLEIKKFVSNGDSSSSDQIVPKKETRLKLTMKKKENHHEQTNLPQYPTKGTTGTNSLQWISSKVRLMKKKKKKIISSKDNKQHDQSSNLSNLERNHHNHLNKISTNHYDIIVNQHGYYGRNDSVTRICSDCNTTKTPLWRSGPRGPKSLCNACGIRQRKARRAAMAMATATAVSDISPPLVKKKIQNKNKRFNGPYNRSSPSASNECKRMISLEETATSKSLETGQSKSTMLSSSSSSDKFYLDDLAIILSKSSAYNQVCPQDEKEAAILLMALSYGMVHG